MTYENDFLFTETAIIDENDLAPHAKLTRNQYLGTKLKNLYTLGVKNNEKYYNIYMWLKHSIEDNS